LLIDYYRNISIIGKVDFSTASITNTMIWCSRNISYYNHSLMDRKFKRTEFIWNRNCL